MKNLEKIVINVKDIQRITGICDKNARKLMNNIRKELNKSKHHFVTFKEFYAYTGICVFFNVLMSAYISLVLNGSSFSIFDFGFTGQGFQKFQLIRR